MSASLYWIGPLFKFLWVYWCDVVMYYCRAGDAVVEMRRSQWPSCLTKGISYVIVLISLYWIASLFRNILCYLDIQFFRLYRVRFIFLSVSKGWWEGRGSTALALELRLSCISWPILYWVKFFELAAFSSRVCVSGSRLSDSRMRHQHRYAEPQLATWVLFDRALLSCVLFWNIPYSLCQIVYSTGYWNLVLWLGHS